MDTTGNAYVIGNTTSVNFPTVGAFQPTLKGTTDAFVTKIDVDATTVQFTQGRYVVEESTPSLQVDVSRSGDLSSVTTVDYGTVNGTASDRTDYTAALGTLRFDPGESLKSFNVLFTDDALVEGSETLTISLSNANGAVLSPPGSSNLPSSAMVEIRDNDVNPDAPNPIED